MEGLVLTVTHLFCVFVLNQIKVSTFDFTFHCFGHISFYSIYCLLHNTHQENYEFASFIKNIISCQFRAKECEHTAVAIVFNITCL